MGGGGGVEYIRGRRVDVEEMDDLGLLAGLICAGGPAYEVGMEHAVNELELGFVGFGFLVFGRVEG